MKNKKCVLCVIGIILFILIIVVSIFFLNDNKKDKNQEVIEIKNEILNLNRKKSEIGCFIDQEKDDYNFQVGTMIEFKDDKVYTYYEYIYKYKKSEKYELEKEKNINKENFVFNDEKMIIIEKTELKEKKDIDIDKYIKNLSMNPTCMLVK